MVVDLGKSYGCGFVFLLSRRANMIDRERLGTGRRRKLGSGEKALLAST
jgi:hypothetical protein